ncbi:MAG TPA: BrnA antitoxin family protein [Candidatus Acidoferrales bacterium]|nr:BrnA antitoxin family protein [Candidatus Acidoferrales bacterium]
MKTRADEQDQELAALVRLRDEDIDTSDIPEATDWSKAVVGKFYRPIKEPVTLRMDLDVLVWLKSEGPGYQTRINTLLRAAMTGRSQAKAPLSREIEAAPSVLSVGELRFPGLEKHGELEKYEHLAQLIEGRHSLFAPTS